MFISNRFEVIRMNRFIIKMFSIILILFSFTSSLVCKSSFESYINSIFYCIYDRKYEIKFENHIPSSEEKSLLIYLRETINELEKNINIKKIIVCVYYNNTDKTFVLSVSEKNEKNINPKYV